MSGKITETTRLSVYDGKYTFIVKSNGEFTALRYGQPWRNCAGDGAMLALVHEVEKLRERLAVYEKAANEFLHIIANEPQKPS